MPQLKLAIAIAPVHRDNAWVCMGSMGAIVHAWAPWQHEHMMQVLDSYSELKRRQLPPAIDQEPESG